MQTITGTGLSGLVGSRIVELLSEKYSFENLDLTTGVDVTNPNIIDQKISSSVGNVVVHTAAFTDVDKAWEQQGDKTGLCYRINVLGTRNIAQACQKFNKYLIHISTDFVFDGKKRLPYTEEDKPNPIEWYGQTKLWAEEEVINSKAKNIILRISFPYKAKFSLPKLEPNPKLDLVRKIIEKLKTNQPTFMFFDQIITPTFIDDISKVIDYCILNRPAGLYNCVGSQVLSPYDLASIVAGAFSLDKSLIRKSTIKLFEGENFRPRQIYQAVSNKKLENDFGIKMSTINEALQKIKVQIEK